MASRFAAALATAAVIALAAAAPEPLFAEDDQVPRPQMGVWFGPVTPVPATQVADNLRTFLGGGVFFRINWPFNLIRSEVGTSWSYYTSRGTAGLHLVPVYGMGVYRLPLNLPLQFQVKAGGGSVWVDTAPENKQRWNPLGMIGFEGSFPAGRRVNIGLRWDYLMVMESHLDPPPKAPPGYETNNYHFFNFGLMVNFFLTR